MNHVGRMQSKIPSSLPPSFWRHSNTMRSNNIQPSFSVSQKKKSVKKEGMLVEHLLLTPLMSTSSFCSLSHPLFFCFSLFYFPLIMRWHKTHYGMGFKTGRNKGCERKEFLLSPSLNFREGRKTRKTLLLFLCTHYLLLFFALLCVLEGFSLRNPQKGTHAQNTEYATTDKKNWQQK